MEETIVFKYVVEEETFRILSSTEHFSNPEAEEEDDEVDNTDDDRDASSKKEENLVDDKEKQRNEFSDDKVEEAEKGENSDNGSHQSGGEGTRLFQPPTADVVIKPLLNFLNQTNSSFLINLRPYDVYKAKHEIPIGFALFRKTAFNLRDDEVTGVRYQNLFDAMEVREIVHKRHQPLLDLGFLRLISRSVPTSRCTVNIAKIKREMKNEEDNPNVVSYRYTALSTSTDLQNSDAFFTNGKFFELPEIFDICIFFMTVLLGKKHKGVLVGMWES
ncbi:hypothetical protein RHSIM_Rhsim05G0218200 [Rhododendron simsii]|uniref:Uncharacterized protein n=1 Tax=Rhododendron simsii TaxID=118357 RepID=A0A834LM94_RHOSS|nr:hypothetical protein RHSIM_Rhsim05G0218200 [Rhododendron simsii]